MTKWRVTNQTQRDELIGGRFVPMVTVTFQLTETETEGSIRVPLSSYTAEFVASAINDYAQRLHAVDNLTGG
jgi:hypothetical protein